MMASLALLQLITSGTSRLQSSSNYACRADLATNPSMACTCTALQNALVHTQYHAHVIRTTYTLRHVQAGPVHVGVGDHV